MASKLSQPGEGGGGAWQQQEPIIIIWTPVIKPGFTASLGRRSFSDTCVGVVSGEQEVEGDRSRGSFRRHGGRQRVLMDDLAGRGGGAAVIRDLSGEAVVPF